MEYRTSDSHDPAWFLAGVQAQEGDLPEPDERTPPNVIIAVSLDELDGLAGDMLV